MIKRVHGCGETSVPYRQNCRLQESKTTSEASLQFTTLKIAFVVDGKAAEIAERVGRASFYGDCGPDGEVGALGDSG